MGLLLWAWWTVNIDRHSTALSSKCEQCHVVSWCRKLKTDLLINVRFKNLARCTVHVVLCSCARQKPLYILSWPPTVQPIQKSFPYLVTIVTGYLKGKASLRWASSVHCHLLLSTGTCCRYWSIAGTKQPHADASVDRRDGLTPDRYIDPAPHILCRQRQ